MILSRFRHSESAPSAKLIVGLGNPGKEYEGTRHNVGWDAIELLAKRNHIFVKARRNRAIVGEGTIAGKKVVLARPLTFMNLSGEAVAGLARRYRINPEDIVVICDDVNLDLGRLRIRAQGSAGGHNGLKSIIHSLGTQDFPRVRIGVGSPQHDDMIKHVLSRFNRAERSIVKEAIDEAVDAVEMIVSEGIEPAMNRFNAAKPPASKSDIDKSK
jgi:peptidyl-tRNA hydrolase, PTH1 family